MKRLIVILGPTAAGKTAAAIRLAQHLHCEIISCDSRQFYEELSIGVARPEPEELAAVKHHFIACRPVSQPYNAFQYAEDALETMQTLFASNDNIIAVGGSGLYIDALCKGINVLPDPPAELRRQLSDKIANGGLPELLEELQRLDPEYYEIVDKKNPIRIQRALEVIITSGRPYSSLVGIAMTERPFKTVKIGIARERDELRDRIYRRTDQMIEKGHVEEVASLLPYRHLNTLNTVGYKEMFQYLDGHLTLEQAATQIKNHTWQYAKKQMTWFKRYPETIWTEEKNIFESLQEIENKQY